MHPRKFPLRILLLGRETGPLAQLLKNYFVKPKIGAVDVLGNMETRKYSDWKFSVIKQYPHGSLARKKKKSTVDLLFDLAGVMLEEKKFDLIIPLAPFHRYPDKIKQLRNVCEIALTTQESLESTYSNYLFIDRLIEEFPQFISYYNKFKKENISDENKEGVFITKTHKFLFTSETKNEEFKDPAIEGYFLPLREIHCAGFFSSDNSVSFLGFQTLKSPDGHKFINNDFERNSYYPFNTKLNYGKDIPDLVRIIEHLNLIGLIGIFFGIIDNQIVPFSCNVLPDENIDLWMNKTNNDLIPSLVNMIQDPDTFSKAPLFGYKIPIYSSELLSVPTIPPELATQRNLPGITAHHKHPICAILGTSNTYRNVERKMFGDREKVQHTLGIFNR